MPKEKKEILSKLNQLIGSRRKHTTFLNLLKLRSIKDHPKLLPRLSN